MGATCGGEGDVVREPPKTPLQKTADSLAMQVTNLDQKIAQADIEIRQHVAMGALSEGNKVAKQRALQIMKMKKLYEQQRENLLGTHFNVESLVSQQAQADVNLAAFEAMKQSQEMMRLQTANMSVDQVENLKDQMELLGDEMQLINESLAQSNPMAAGEDADIEAEYAKLAGETAAGKHVGVPAPAKPAKVPAAPAPSRWGLLAA